jgi:hypothetical protein
MLSEIEQMSQNAKNERESALMAQKLAQEAEIHFLNSLIAWGPTKVLKEYIKLYKYIRNHRRGNISLDADLQSAEVSLQRRYLQTAAGYLDFSANQSPLGGLPSVLRFEANYDDSPDSLYDISFLLRIMAPRAPLVALPEDLKEEEEAGDSTWSMAPNSRICLDSMARLRMMQDRYDLALQCFLAIGAFHSPRSIEELEASAIDAVNSRGETRVEKPILIGLSSYEFVLGVIEYHHLHQCLLKEDFVLSTDSKLFMPLFALLRLVGLELMGEFLIEHCVSPVIKSPSELAPQSSNINDGTTRDLVRRETLPIDQVAEQLEKSPALLHWYLHLVFTRKPEIYVKFPNTANPPKAVTDLHRKHFDLYIKYAGAERDSAKSLSGTDTYKLESKTTPLLQFLKVRTF